MADHAEELDQRAAEIRRRFAEMSSHLAKQRDDLRAVQQLMTPKQFKQWALRELGMDEATLQDFLAFDGSTDGMTERMERHFMHIITGGRTS